MRESLDITKAQVARIIGTRAEEKFTRQMFKVKRGEGIKGAPDNFDNNGLHVSGIFPLYDVFLISNPRISEFINDQDFRFMIYIHDLPEIYIGDFSHQNGKSDQAREDHKKREIHVFNIGVAVASDENKPLFIKARELQIRFEQHLSNDRTATLAKFFDYYQAMVHANNYGLLDNLNHGTNVKTVRLADQFLNSLPDGEVKEQAINYFESLWELSHVRENLPKDLYPKGHSFRKQSAL